MKYRWNRYGDLEIDIGELHVTPDTIEDVIEREIVHWKSKIKNRRGEEFALMWLKIPTLMSDCISRLVKKSFKIHHATPEYIMMVLPHTHMGKPPAYGTHYTRVECLVVEKTTGKILLVRENTGPAGAPKLVTGSVDQGEFVTSAAVREVKEETGIDCTVIGTMGSGNRLGTRFRKDEILIGVLLSASSGQVPTVDGTEISSAEWMTPDDALVKCSSTTREWILAAGKNIDKILQPGFLPDFRGPPHRMQVFFPTPTEKDGRKHIL